MAAAVDDRLPATPSSWTDTNVLVPWLLRALGSAAGVPIAFLMVYIWFGDDIRENIQVNTDSARQTVLQREADTLYRAQAERYYRLLADEKQAALGQ